MIIFKIAMEIHSFLLNKKEEFVDIGFIPTMGALHNGHIGLVFKARQENQLVICSIFVNPTQFNDSKDFEKYPSTIENDIYLLEKAGCDVLFLPSVNEIYPAGIKATKHYDLGNLETQLEGEFRPGHFQGVCQVVNRLLDVVIPDKLYLGQKDFQQCMVLKKLVTILKLPTQIVVCQTQRETDGLAMSSRNTRLNKTDREIAPAIYKALVLLKRTLKPGITDLIKTEARELLVNAGFRVEYVEIVDANSFELTTIWDGNTPVVALIAAWLNEVRLIDNLILTDNQQ
jgi:pantoate--beta-alanine ligase